MADADGLIADDLFAPLADGGTRYDLAPGAMLLRGFARAAEADLKIAVAAIAAASPFRHMTTPGGFRMSVSMTNCGRYGWVSSAQGYRYAEQDPNTGAPWPSLPGVVLELARSAAATVGYADFAPDACLVNRYEPGSRLTLHQDRNERDFSQPIVSVSLGVPATFLFGGVTRKERPLRLSLTHGDVVVWGGPSRLRYHGVAPLAEAHHPFAGSLRINLTLRRA